VRIDVKLLGGFEVLVDGIPVPSTAWSRRHAASLVKLLALAPGRRLHREQVIEALWPGISLDAAAPRLHKATHYARKALGATAVETRAEALWLGADTNVDVDGFYNLADQALENGALETIEAALAAYRGPL
jgi:DNA-binding SARP family transcriptional activator